jgi:hypothetical protein
MKQIYERLYVFEASNWLLFLEDPWHAGALQGYEIPGQHCRIKANE